MGKRGINRLNKELEWLEEKIEETKTELDMYKKWKISLTNFIVRNKK